MAIIGCIEDLQINERLFYSNKKFNPIVAAKSIWRLRRDAFSLDLLWSATSSSSKILPGCYGDRWPKTPTERSLLHPHQDLVRFVRLRRSRRWPGTSRSWPSRWSLSSQQTSLLQIFNRLESTRKVFRLKVDWLHLSWMEVSLLSSPSLNLVFLWRRKNWKRADQVSQMIFNVGTSHLKWVSELTFDLEKFFPAASFRLLEGFDGSMK